MWIEISLVVRSFVHAVTFSIKNTVKQFKTVPQEISLIYHIFTIIICFHLVSVSFCETTFERLTSASVIHDVASNVTSESCKQCARKAILVHFFGCYYLDAIRGCVLV